MSTKADDRGLKWQIGTRGEGRETYLSVQFNYPEADIPAMKLSAEGALLLAADLLQHATEAVIERRL